MSAPAPMEGCPAHAADAADAEAWRLALERLRRWGGPELLRDMTALFLAETPPRLTRLRDGALTGDAAAVADVAHALRATSGQMGAVAMQRLCEELERRARRGALAELAPLLDALDEAHERFRARLRDAVPGSGEAS